jgi:hypothetical protein
MLLKMPLYGAFFICGAKWRKVENNGTSIINNHCFRYFYKFFYKCLVYSKLERLTVNEL